MKMGLTLGVAGQESLAGFRKVPKTGVIYVMDEASKAGYCAATAQEWATWRDV